MAPSAVSLLISYASGHSTVLGGLGGLFRQRHREVSDLPEVTQLGSEEPGFNPRLCGTVKFTFTELTQRGHSSSQGAR